MGAKEKIGKWSPLRIPDAFRQYTDQTEDSGDPFNSWDASDWNDPEASGLKSRLTPNHAGQWMILGAAVFLFLGFILWLGQFFPLTHRNPWTLVAFAWPASLLVAHVHAREVGFNAASRLEWAFITTGRSVRVIPGKFAGRFGEGDIQHVKFNMLKSRSYGAFRFNFLKLGDLEASRDKLVSKAHGTNRGPDSLATLLLPGPLTGENADTAIGRVFGVHGGAVQFHDSGDETDMRVTPPATLDDAVAADVLNQLELYDQRIIPELKAEIRTVEVQKNRYKQRAEAERDPELDRMLSSVETMAEIIRGSGRQRSRSRDSDSEADEITRRAREQVDGDS